MQSGFRASSPPAATRCVRPGWICSRQTQHRHPGARAYPRAILALAVDAPSLFVSLFLGLVGTGLFMYGKRQSRVPHLAVGIVLLVYPWFGLGWVPNALIGAVLMGLLVLGIRLGL
jgi:hypothetical protein